MYRRLCCTLNDRGTLIPDTDYIFDHIIDFNKDYYLSIFKYNEEQKKKFYEKTDGIINGAKNINDVIDFINEPNKYRVPQEKVEGFLLEHVYNGVSSGLVCSRVKEKIEFAEKEVFSYG